MALKYFSLNVTGYVSDVTERTGEKFSQSKQKEHQLKRIVCICMRTRLPEVKVTGL